MSNKRDNKEILDAFQRAILNNPIVHAHVARYMQDGDDANYILTLKSIVVDLVIQNNRLSELLKENISNTPAPRTTGRRA